MRLSVTAALGARDPDLRAAEEAARRHSVPFVPRRNRPLPEVAAEAGAGALAVLGAERVSLFLDGREHRWSAGMGILRAKRLRQGERDTRDPFLEAAELRPGESVLDCTLGLCADALVASAAVGPSGAVVGLESSPALALLAGEGLRRLPDEAAERIEVRRADAAELLPTLPSRSFDLVVFDPMFRHPRAQARGFDLVRRLGDPRPLAAATLAQALRVARRAVLVKDATPGWDLARLGLVPLPGARGAHRLYARVPPPEADRSRPA
jgi:SAM-dependent methyltransferase